MINPNFDNSNISSSTRGNVNSTGQESIKPQQPQDQTSKQAQFNTFSGDVEKQLKELELSFSKQLAELRKKLNSQIVEIEDETNIQNNQNTAPTNTNININPNIIGQKESKVGSKIIPENNKSQQPLSYSVHYSSSSVFKDGVRDTKEHIEFKNPEVTVVADRIPGKEDFEVKTLKHGENQPTTQQVPANQLKIDIDSLYGNLQKSFHDDFSKFPLAFGARAPLGLSSSLFGSDDLPMLHSSKSQPVQQSLQSSGNNNTSNPARPNRPFGSDFFRDEIMNIDKELEFMLRRMDHEKKRFFDYF